jgi:hypothetical protein
MKRRNYGQGQYCLSFAVTLLDWGVWAGGVEGDWICSIPLTYVMRIIALDEPNMLCKVTLHSNL